jgi:hypothetical protein
MAIRIRRPFRVVAIAFVLLTCISLVSCTSSVPYRTTSIEESPECRLVFKQNDEMTAGEGTIAASLKDSPCWLRSMEEHLEYDLFTVEFDDQGWLQGTSKNTPSPKDHMHDFLLRLEKLYNENQQNGLSIVVYVHGWHGNARPDDGDMINFRKFLGQIKVAENGRTLSADPRNLTDAKRVYSDEPVTLKRPRVVGVYVGWRGESLPIGYLRKITFWERKGAAEQVAQGSVRELFQQLDYARDCGRTGLDWKATRKKLSQKEQEEERQKKITVGYRNVRMLTIGHSFGGLVTYRALSSEFIGYAVRASADEFVSRLGDMVIIVNPAFEGARYEPLHVAGRRIGAVKHNQLPTIIIATTKADWATKYAFPAARIINTIFEMPPGDEYAAAVFAVGHNKRYQTHSLALCNPKTNPDCEKACRPPSPDKKVEAGVALSKERDAILAEAELMDRLGEQGFKDKTYLCSNLELTTNGELLPPNNPFWVVSTKGEIMRGHNDIFNERFVSFFRQMYLSITLARLKNPAAPRCTR